MTDETDLGIKAIERAHELQLDAERPHKTRQDRVITFLIVGVAVVTALTLAIGVFSLPILTSGSDAANATKESNEITACRAAFNVNVTEASVALDDATRDVDLLTNEVLQAVLQKDQQTIDRDLPLIAPARGFVEAKRAERQTALDVYKDAVSRSSKDPAGFLADCRANPPS